MNTTTTENPTIAPLSAEASAIIAELQARGLSLHAELQRVEYRLAVGPDDPIDLDYGLLRRLHPRRIRRELGCWVHHHPDAEIVFAYYRGSRPSMRRIASLHFGPTRELPQNHWRLYRRVEGE
jgi:hypothetical protein